MRRDAHNEDTLSQLRSDERHKNTWEPTARKTKAKAEKGWCWHKAATRRDKHLEQDWDTLPSLAKEHGWTKDIEEMTKIWKENQGSVLIKENVGIREWGHVAYFTGHLCSPQVQPCKHEFQTGYDRRRKQKINEKIESQQEEIHRAQAEERHRRDQQLLHSNWSKTGTYVKLMRKVSMKWKNWRSSRVPPSTLFREEDQLKTRTLFWNLLARYRICKMKLIVWMIQKIFRMLNQFAVEIHTLPVNQCHSHLIQFLKEC